MGPARTVGSIAVILVAGSLAYVSYAAGEAGPMVTFGRGDANHAAPDAWVQLPLHLAVALGFAVAGPTGVRRVAWRASVVATALLTLWAAALVILGLASFGAYADALDVLVSMILVWLYGAAMILSRRPADSRDPGAREPDRIR